LTALRRSAVRGTLYAGPDCVSRTANGRGWRPLSNCPAAPGNPKMDLSSRRVVTSSHFTLDDRNMRSLAIVVAWFAASCMPLQVSAQVADWEMYKPHALKAWKTYREQFDCVAVSGEDSSLGMKYDMYVDKISEIAIITMRRGSREKSAFVRHVIVEKNRCTIIEKATSETEFRVVHDFSSLVPEELERVQYHQKRIESVLFPLLYVMGGPIDKIFEQGEGKVLAVSVDEKAPNLVTVELEIAENLLSFYRQQEESPELVKAKVVFDAERLWIIKAHDITWLEGRKFHVRNETVGFLGCAVCSRSTSTSAFPVSEHDHAVQIELTKLTHSLASPELVSSKIAEARALVGEK
jgi:hypothetical protein